MKQEYPNRESRPGTSSLKTKQWRETAHLFDRNSKNKNPILRIVFENA